MAIMTYGFESVSIGHSRGGTLRTYRVKTKSDKLYVNIILLYICALIQSAKIYKVWLEYADSRYYQFDYFKLSRQLAHFGYINNLGFYKKYYLSLILTAKRQQRHHCDAAVSVTKFLCFQPVKVLFL